MLNGAAVGFYFPPAAYQRSFLQSKALKKSLTINSYSTLCQGEKKY